MTGNTNSFGDFATRMPTFHTDGLLVPLADTIGEITELPEVAIPEEMGDDDMASYQLYGSACATLTGDVVLTGGMEEVYAQHGDRWNSQWFKVTDRP